MPLDRRTPDPSAPALLLGDDVWSYATLWERADRLASWLAARGIGAGSVLALTQATSIQTVLMLHACAQLESTLFPLDPAMAEARRERLLELARAAAIVKWVDEGLELKAEPIDLQRIPREDAPNRKGRARAALIIATSGSSGEPKGVMLGAEGLRAGALAVNGLLGFGADDCWLDCLPLFHIGGLAILHRAIVTGGSVALHGHFDAERLWDDLKHQPATHLSLVPAMLARLLDVADGPPPSRLRAVLIGGDALSPLLAQRAVAAGWPLWASYGMSETGALAAAAPLGPEQRIPPLVPIPGLACEVVDETGGPTQDIGRIRLQGNTLMLGYANSLGRPGEGLDSEGGFLTGDLGRIDANGHLQVVGRAGETLISGGEKVYPQEVEARLLHCPGVDFACVTGVPDPVWGQIVCAHYTGSATPTELDAWCRGHIPGAARPRQIIRLERIPLLPNGKVDRQGLKKTDRRM